MLMPGFLETRYLKRPKLGPPDVYPQNPKQKEDELNLMNVKTGFKYVSPCNDEHSSAQPYSVDSNKINRSFSALLMQKQIVNTYNDSGKKRPQLTKDNFSLVPVINTKIRSHIAWFKELGSHKPLSQLCKSKVPVFNKKEEIFQSLADFEIPLVRAAWFIKMTAAYHLTQTDAKMKKRAACDPNTDWTQAISKFMREQLLKLDENESLSEIASSSGGNVGLGQIYMSYISSTTGSTTCNLSKIDLRKKQLKYISNLAHHMYTEGLLDRHEFLSWVVEELELIPLHNETALGYFMPFLLQYVEDIAVNHLLARRMSFTAAQQLNWMLAPSVVSEKDSLIQCSLELLPIVHTLSCAIQTTMLCCPSALVWYPPTDAKFCGSPLDLLPCPPSELPLPDLEKEDAEGIKQDKQARGLLIEKENEITLRSNAVELHWTSNKNQDSSTGCTINRVLNSLEALDKQNFERLSSVEILYHKIFSHQTHSKLADTQIPHPSENSVIKLLCEWAITPNRLGEHRAAVVAKILDKRQTYFEQINKGNHSINNLQNGHCQSPYFQNLLFNFLDDGAPELKNPDNSEEAKSFQNLVLLFSELMEHDVFSHNHFINALISRGDISPGQLSSLPLYSNSDPSTDLNMVTTNDLKADIPLSMETQNSLERNESKSDFNIVSESLFSPDSHQDRHFLDAVRQVDQLKPNHNVKTGLSTNTQIWGYGQSKHIQYIMHFPIPYQDESNSYEWNQRLMLLYGAGRQKAQVKKAVRRIMRHLIKLIHNKRKIDNTKKDAWELETSKRISKTSHGDFVLSYQNLPYFDKHMVSSTVAKTIVSSLENVICGRSSIPPQLSVISFLFDLMEEALNISTLVETAVSVCSCLIPLLQALENFAVENTWYPTELSLIVVAVLRHYQSYLLLNPDMMRTAFDGLFAFAKQTFLHSTAHPPQCSSPDKNILVLLNDLYTPVTNYIKANIEFGNYVAVVRQVLSSTKKPATSNCRYDADFLKPYIENPEMESCLTVPERYSKQLHDPAYRYSFVCSVIINLCCGSKNLEKVHALAALCAEMSARCSELSAEWLGVLKALCKCPANFTDVLMAVETRDPLIRDPLALFTAVLIARSCLSLEDVIQHVAIPSLLAACNGTATTSNPNTGAWLTCHLLLQLFKAPLSPNSDNSQSFYIPSSSDRHLLYAAQRNTAEGAVLAVLKAVLKLGDSGRNGHKGEINEDMDVSVTSFLAPIQDFDDFHDALPSSSDHEEKSWMEQASLRDFAKHAVRVICSQQWVRDRCLKYPNMDLLMDQVLTKEQRQTLIHLICYADGDLKRLSLLSTDPQKYVCNMLAKMSKWTLRQCLLELQVMLSESGQEKNLPEHIARATIVVFHKQQIQDMEQNYKEADERIENSSVWLIAPLISKLSPKVQARVLQQACEILEAPPDWSGISIDSSHMKSDRLSNSSLLNHQPFLTLIITCLKGQDEEQDSLVESLQSQITMMHSEWQITRSQRDTGKDPPHSNFSQNGRNEVLQLRLSLVGGMFDIIQSNSQRTSDIVILLTRLIHCGMVDVQINKDIYHTVYDMIAVLLHHTLGGDTQSRQDGSKREYLNIVKKIKKEIGEHQTKSLTQLRQLLPIQRPDLYIVCCEPNGPLVDIKGIKFPVSADGSSGLQANSKQKLNPWEIIEGLKNPAPLCLAWFGARKTERKLLKYEEAHIHLMHHQHGDKRYLEEYLKRLQFPPEEDESIPPGKNIEKKLSMKNASSPSTGDRKSTGKKVTRRPSKRNTKTTDTNAQLYRAPGPATIGSLNRQPFHGLGNPSQSNYTMHQPNPPGYQNYGVVNKPLRNPYSQSQGYTLKNKGMLESKQVLGMHIRNRQVRQGSAQFRASNAGLTSGYIMDGTRSNPVRNKLENMIKAPINISHDMYMKQPVRNQLQQPHIIGQPSNSNYMPFNMVPKQQMMHGYNNAGTNVYHNNPQAPYPQTNVMQGNQTFITSQSGRTGNYSIPQQGNYQQTQLNPIQNQPQYQHVHQAQMTRMGGQQIGSGIHSVNTAQSLQTAQMINPHSMIDPHSQIINSSQQFNQNIQAGSQVSSGNIPRSMMGQQQF